MFNNSGHHRRRRSDFWSYIRAPRPHRWAIWGVALALTWVIFHRVSRHI
jgi:hypothetical protein